MYYVNQTEYPHVPYPTMTGVPELLNTSTTIASAGCGVCSASMVVTNLTGELFQLAQAMELSMSVGANHGPGTDMSLLAPYVAERFDLDLVVSIDAEVIASYLRQGYLAIANVGGDRPEDNYIGLFSHGGHFVTVVGIDEAGVVTVLDPSFTTKKFLEEGRVGRVTVNGHILHCPLDVLLEDCKSRPVECYPEGSEFRAFLDAMGEADAGNKIYLFGEKE